MYCLIVDDDEDCLFICNKIIMDEMHYYTRAVNNASEALAICEKRLPQLILLDWHMPKMSGMEFMEELRRSKNGFNTCVVMCTAVNEREKFEEAVVAGARGYVLKPFTKENILKQLSGLGFKPITPKLAHYVRKKIKADEIDGG